MYIYILYIYINICICICVVFPSVQDYSYIWEYICIDPSLQTCKHLQLQSCFFANNMDAFTFQPFDSGAADLLSATEGDKANKKPVLFEDVARYELYVGFLFGRGVLVVFFYQEVTNPSPCRPMAMLCRP